MNKRSQMGAQTPGGIARNINVAQKQTDSNISDAQPQMRAREGFQQRGPAFERFMQDQAFKQRALQEQDRRAAKRNPLGGIQ